MRRGRGRVVAWVLWLSGYQLGSSGCQFASPPTEGTAYRCEGFYECPGGYVCRAGVCKDAYEVDARIDPIDASNQPEPDERPDAGQPADASEDGDRRDPDASPDATPTPEPRT